MIEEQLKIVVCLSIFRIMSVHPGVPDKVQGLFIVVQRLFYGVRPTKRPFNI